MSPMASWLAPDHLRRVLGDLIQNAEGPAGVEPMLIARIEVAAPGVDPLGWVAAQRRRIKGYWVDRDHALEIAAIGEADEVKSPDAADFVAWQRTMEQRWAAGRGDYRYFGGFRFGPWHPSDHAWRPFGAYRFILPEFEVVRRSGEDTRLACNLVFRAGFDPRPAALALLSEMTFPSTFEPGRMDAPLRRADEPEQHHWRQAVGEALAAIAAGRVDKVVLARRTCFDFDRPVDAFTLLRRIQQDAGRCYQFCGCHDAGFAFIGASPERLYGRTGRALVSEAVAGTRPRGQDAAADDALAAELLASDKERLEHRLVVDGIAERLAPVSAGVHVEPEPSVLKLARLQHLYTRIGATLRAEATDADLLRLLHPTPAVGGTPVAPALELLLRLERFDRGWYTGPVGWIARDAAEFAVGLRCGLAAGPRLCLYSGAGIVDGSDPDVEWREIESKLGSFLRILQAP